MRVSVRWMLAPWEVSIGRDGDCMAATRSSRPKSSLAFADTGLAERGALARYLVAATLARLADEGARVAFLLLALEQTGSATFGGLLVAALLMPHVVAAPLAGAVADRAQRRRRFHAASVVLFGGFLALCAVLVGRAPAGLVIAVAAAGGVVGPLLTGGLSGLLRNIVPPDRVANAYGLDVVTYNAAGICGPALAAVIAGWAGAEASVLALASGTVVSAAVLMSLPISDATPNRETASLTRAFAQGFGVFLQSRGLRTVTAASCIAQLGAGALPVAAAVLATDVAESSAVGILLSAFAVGGLFGSLGYARVPIGSGRPERVVIVCFAAAAVPLALLAAGAWGVPVAAALFAVMGFLSGPQGAALFIVRDREAPPQIHTQVFTTGAGLKMTSSAAGAAVAGVMAGTGAAALFAGAAAAHLVAAVVGAALMRRRP